MKFNIQSALGAIGTAAIATTVAAVTTISAPIAANAATFNFNNIVADNAGELKGDPLAQFLSMDVTASGGGTLFKFSLAENSLPGFGGSFIRQVFIDGSTTLLGTATVNSGNVVVGGVAFSGGASSQNFAQGNKVGFSTDYYFNRNNGAANVNAIQEGESLGVLFANANFNNVIAAINSGDLRVGYHAQGLIDGASDSYINGIPTTPPPKPVPVPGFLLGLAVAGAFGGSRLLKSKKQSA
ncbi:hypothetical protein H6F44_18750 [Pseudanabaena sp. FACHB-1277]|uniref:PEP-CTERM sorting domain-containing protein n=1 Tax=Pseudanabaena cinerea FACHB-1277 TaxID=2949581 RepID=A0A926UY63_9CYAN|nr:hypothetical protein [Pseudanabaena cinerea]MBD2152142.1 hypothetical protein [Pseudanabaena cinerea FACHB-1277]